MSDDEYWYRYDGICYAPIPDEFGECYGIGDRVLRRTRYLVLKHTPKGVWIEYSGRWHTDKRFILREANKRFACPTPKEALESFLARKIREKRIYLARLKDVDRFIELAHRESNLPSCLTSESII